MDWDGSEGQSKPATSKIKERSAEPSIVELQGMSGCPERSGGRIRERYSRASGVPAARSPNNRPRTHRGDVTCAGTPRHGEERSSTTAIIGLVIVSHGGLARGFAAALEHIVGPQAQLEAISIAPDDDVETQRKAILAAARRVDTGAGVVLLTDMFGGTPSNLAISVLDEANVEVIAGVNLPMLVKLASVRGEMPLAKAVDLAKEAGRKYITVASQVLAGEPSAHQRPAMAQPTPDAATSFQNSHGPPPPMDN
jgi:mannose PTS system EIIA component